MSEPRCRAAAASAYVVPRARACEHAARSAIEAGSCKRHRVQRRARERRRSSQNAVSIPTTQRRLRPQGRERRGGLDGAAEWTRPAIAPDLRRPVSRRPRSRRLLEDYHYYDKDGSHDPPQLAEPCAVEERWREKEHKNGTLSFCKGAIRVPGVATDPSLRAVAHDRRRHGHLFQRPERRSAGRRQFVCSTTIEADGQRVVLPTLSVALGTLLATTINVLRNRQVDIRAALNKEACELRLLRAALLGAYGTAQHAGRRAEALDLVRAYSARIVAESSPGAFEAIRREERAGGVGVNELEPLGRMLHGVDGAFAARQGSVQAYLQLLNELIARDPSAWRRC